MKKAIVILLASVATASFAQQAGDLDSTFGVGGLITIDFDNDLNYGKSIALQPDGKILVAGTTHQINWHFALTRLNKDGSLDSSFGINGKVVTLFNDDEAKANAIAIGNNGKIVVARYAESSRHDTIALRNFDFALICYNSDGSADSSFGADGKVITEIGSNNDEINAIAIQPDDKIVVAGSSDYGNGINFSIARYNIDGSLDSSFNSNGIVTTQFIGGNIAYSLAIQNDGKILVGGYSTNGTINVDFALVRLNPDGSLDSNFGSGGKLDTDFGSNDFARGIAIQTDGRIIAAGYTHIVNSNQAFALARYNQDGSLDNDFGINGKSITDFSANDDLALSVAIQSDGKIVLAGISTFNDNNQYSDFALARYNTNGFLDGSFGINGKLNTDFTEGNDEALSVAIQSDGKIIVAGNSNNTNYTDFALARCLSGLNLGIVEFSQSESNVLIYPNPIGGTATLEYTLTQPETITIRLLDMQGKTIKTFIANTQREAGSHQQAITLPASLPAGSYLIVIESEKGRMGVRVSKV